MNFIAENISGAQTVAELTALENQHSLNEFEQGLIFERKVEIISRLLEWGAENERVGLTYCKPFGFLDAGAESL